MFRAIVLPHQGLAVIVVATQTRVERKHVGAIVILFPVQPPVAIGIIGGITAVSWIKAIGLLPDICHAVEVGIVFVTIVCVG